MGQQFDGELAEAAYRALLMDPSTWRMRPTTADGAQLAPMSNQHFNDGLTRFEARRGEWAGTWLFVPPSTFGRWPRAAIRMRLGAVAPYSVVIDLYCKPAQCDALRELLPLAWLPQPAYDDGEDAELAWTQQVAAESCQRGPKRQPQPTYPPDEVRNEVGGTAELILLMNRCGEVRDVRVRKSTGNRSLDRAAVAAAYSWRIPAGGEGTALPVALAPITFVPSEPLPPGITDYIEVKD